MSEEKPKNEAAAKKIAVIQEYKDVFLSPKGRKVLWHLMQKYGIFTTTMHGDPHVTSFAEGQRAVVLEILKTLKINQNELLDRMLAADNNTDSF